MAFHSTFSPNFDCLRRAGNQGIAIGNNSLACWVNFANLSGAYEVIEINDSGGFPFASAILLNGNQIEYSQRNAAGTQINFLGGTTLSANTWYHVALTYDGTTLRGYLNGATNGTSTGLTGARGNWADLSVGATLGELQDALFYSAALSADEISQLYRSRQPKRRANLEYALPCYPGANRLVDYSGNGRDFTNGGTPTDSTIVPPPVGWGSLGNRIVVPASSGTAITADGLTQCTGSATTGKAAAVTATGTTNVSGTADMQGGKTAAGTTNVTGSANVGIAYATAASGLTQCTGAAAVSMNAAVTASGLVQTFGTAAVSSNQPSGTANYVHLWRRNRRGR